MPLTDNQGSSSSFRSFGFSIFSRRQEHFHPTGAINPESDARALDFESFQKQIAERFHELAAVDKDDLLSIESMMKHLDAFLYCQEEFRALLNDKIQIGKSPLDHLADEYFKRSIKALDICNAIRDGIEKIHMWQKHLEFVLCALVSSQRAVGEGKIRRARKALMNLALAMLDEKVSGSVSSHWNRSFGRHNTSKDHHGRPPGHARSLFWRVSRNWSASKQLQAIANNLVPPRGNELAASNDLALPFFTMSCVVTFVLWTLVAAILCQDRGINVHFSFPRHYVWAAPIPSLHERITEESKKREYKNSNGCLKEVCETEKCVRNLTDLVDVLQCPISDEQKNEVEECLMDLGLICEALRKVLDPLERQVRDVFRTIMSFRTKGLETAHDRE